VPAAATGGGYVYDPASNTYYQLPGTVVAGWFSLMIMT